MIIGSDFLYLHVPKTGGMSFTDLLGNKLVDEAVFSLQKQAHAHFADKIESEEQLAKFTLVDGPRHGEAHQPA